MTSQDYLYWAAPACSVMKSMTWPWAVSARLPVWRDLACHGAGRRAETELPTMRRQQWQWEWPGAETRSAERQIDASPCCFHVDSRRQRGHRRYGRRWLGCGADWKEKLICVDCCCLVYAAAAVTTRKNTSRKTQLTTNCATCMLVACEFLWTRAVPDFGSGSGSGRNPALFPNPAEIRLRQKSHRSRIVLPDLKSRFFPDIGRL